MSKKRIPINNGSRTRSLCDAPVTRLIRMMATGRGVTIVPNGSHARPVLQDGTKQLRPDLTKVRTLLQWEPMTQLRDSLLKMIADFKQFLRKYPELCR